MSEPIELINGHAAMTLKPPFEFDINGNITFFSPATNIEGLSDFAHHYVSEWILWFRAGRLDASVCDIAALIVAVIGCKFLPNYSLDHKIEWIEKNFLLTNLRKTIPLRRADYSEATLTALRALRPSILLSPEPTCSIYCDQLLEFALPIEKMLVLGGDHRLAVDPNTQLNGYGCRPFPRPEAITFSSSTATSISKYAYDFAEQRRQLFLAEVISKGLQPAVDALSQEVRTGISKQLGIGDNLAEIVIAASGTDSFLIAQGLTHFISDAAITTLIIGVEESGSGVKLALQERHFADDTALAETVQKGQLLSAKSGIKHQIDIPVRDQAGNAIPTRILDAQVMDLVVMNIEAGHTVVVHAMNHSKLGYSGPSKACLIELKKTFGSRVCVVVDACQMRLDREDIVEYLEYQMMVIITGSKFFTGPPFCGAILIPQHLVDTIQANGEKFDIGFNSYCAKEDLPQKLRALLRGHSKDFNLGSLFRWVAAIAEMARYYEIPPLIRIKAIAECCERVENTLLTAPFIELHYLNSGRDSSSWSEFGELSGRRMIFPFFLYYLHDGDREVCSEMQVQQIYKWLNQDCSKLFNYKNAREFRLLAQMCHIGQPVAVNHRAGVKTAVLRMSVGSRIFSESFSTTSGRMVSALIEDEFWQIGVILGKLELLLNAISNHEIS